MKKVLALVLMLTTLTVFAQNEAKDLKFSESVYKFGKIKQNIPATHIFTVTNTGDKPLIIEFASASCGCTTPEYSNAPILKGKSTTIKVTYNAANLGTFKKDVTVKFAKMQQPVILSIEGEVIEAAKSSR
jgi:hypothetical protein